MKIGMSFLYKLFLSGFLLILASQMSLQAAENEDVAGVVLSFDDTYVDHWYDYFGQRTDNNEVKATFFVSHWHTLSDDVIEKLRLLQAKGHEIGSHSYSHKGVAGDYNFDPARIQEYLDDEIIPSLVNMQADGFYPVSFSYPSGERNETYDAAVLQYFPYLRTTFADESNQMFQMDDIFHGPDSQYQILAGDGIDNAYDNPIAEIEAAFLRAKTNNEIVTLYAHRILADDGPDPDYRYGVRISKLDNLIAAAKAMGLKFYTFEEASQIGNQVVPVSSVSATVAGSQVSVNWENNDADFVGIVPIEQTEWQSGMPGVAVSASGGNVTIDVAATANSRSYRAILYKNYVEVARSNVIVIAGSESGGTTDGGTTVSSNITFLGIQEQKARFQWTGLPTDFIGIVPLGESQWQEGMPGADAHGAAADKIGFRITSLVAGQQYIAIFYKDSVEVGRSGTFTTTGEVTGGGTTGGTDGTDGGTAGGTGGGTIGIPNITFLGIQEEKARFQWADLVTDFIGIVPVGVNQWQEGMPGADAHGAVADKMGFKIASLVAGQQYVAVFYRNSAEVGRSVAFTTTGEVTGGTDGGTTGGTGGDTTGGTDGGTTGGDGGTTGGDGGTTGGDGGTTGGDGGTTGGDGGTTAASPNITFLGIQEEKARFQWANLVTDFIGIVPVGESQWQEGMSWADAHGAAADKIGFRVSSLVAGQQYIAIFYRNSVEVGRSVAFTASGT